MMSRSLFSLAPSQANFCVAVNFENGMWVVVRLTPPSLASPFAPLAAFLGGMLGVGWDSGVDWIGSVVL